MRDGPVLVGVSRPASPLPSRNKEHSSSKTLVSDCRHSGRLNNDSGTDSHAQSDRETSSPLDWSSKDGCSYQHPTAVQQVKDQTRVVCVSFSLRSGVKNRDV